MMTDPDRSARTEFRPATELGSSSVTIYAGDGVTVLGTISAAALRARGPVRRLHLAPLVEPRRDPIPEVRAVRTLVGRRKREVEA